MADEPPPTTEAEIWSRTFIPDVGDLTPEADREWLRLRLPARDIERVRELSHIANIGQLTTNQERELDSYLNVVQTFELPQAKARLLLRGKRAE